MDKYDDFGDCYCYPDSTILKNKLNITDGNILESAEREITQISIGNVHYSQPPYDLKYIQNIHILLVSKLAEYYGDFNIIHPFREGNGRVQRLFFEHLVLYNGL